MAKLKIGLIGTGGRGTQHLKTIVGLTDKYDLVGVCDVDEAKVGAASDKFGAPPFTSYEKMMDVAKPDVVTLTVSQRLFDEMQSAAADRGIHVATETPMANTLPEADAMIRRAEEKGIKYENFEQSWRWPRERLKQRLLKSGVMGDMVQARCFSWVAPYHAIGVLLKLVDAHVTTVVGYGRPLPTCPAPEGGRDRNWVLAGLEFENGVSGIFERKIRQPYITGHDFTNCSVDCTRGHILHDAIYIAKDAITPKQGGAFEEVRNVYHFPIQEEDTVINGRPVPSRCWIDTDPVIAWENPFPQYAPEPAYEGRSSGDDIARIEEYLDWHRAVTENVEPGYTVREARHNIEVQIAAYESARQGSRKLTLPLTDPNLETSFW
jgi:predicted dehydrogenase